jgi:hypothetical protein
LFKDFSSGEGGSIIDFVRIKENLPQDIPAILDRLEQLGCGLRLGSTSAPSRTLRGTTAGADFPPVKMPVQEVYEAIKGNERQPVEEYLRKRCIGEEVIEELTRRDLVLHNRWREKSWACFVVRDDKGELRCLVNEEVCGGEKFIYGKKYPFSMDASEVKEASEIYVTEGVMDLLSLRTILGTRCVGFALLGNDPGVVEPSLAEKARVVHAALDYDKGGLMGLMDFREVFPESEIRPLMFNDVKDPNELLMQLRNKREEIPPDARVWLYKQAQKAKNKAEVARRWGVDRSYLYELLREGDEALLGRFNEKKRGRKPRGRPRTLKEALERNEELEREKHALEVAREEEYVVNVFTKLRLKWAEEELKEHGLRPDDDTKPHLKKTEDRNRGRL